MTPHVPCDAILGLISPDCVWINNTEQRLRGPSAAILSPHCRDCGWTRRLMKQEMCVDSLSLPPGSPVTDLAHTSSPALLFRVRGEGAFRAFPSQEYIYKLCDSATLDKVKRTILHNAVAENCHSAEHNRAQWETCTKIKPALRQINLLNNVAEVEEVKGVTPGLLLAM
ncbi:hypothetical protein Bbelb_435840 [Branchiostoma belcheri]|nr:hypothetical protein Bbelb_444340 [Branchiostoma belcheri]KAI8478685.1 hypothetical protein Bbelb_435840 [Branchiostoma belcheri]